MSTASVVHHVPGRMRLRVPAKGDPNRLLAIGESLRSLPRVSEVRTNATVGSVLIIYNPTGESDFSRALAAHASAHQLFELQQPAPEQSAEQAVSSTDRSLDQWMREANRSVQIITSNAVNLKELFPFSLLAYAIFFVNRATGAAQWLSWLQFAFSSYMELHQSEPVSEVKQSVESLRQEIHAMHLELRQMARNAGGG